jgi:hypothetical protein
MTAALTFEASTWAMLLMFGFGVFSVAERVGRRAAAAWWREQKREPQPVSRRHQGRRRSCASTELSPGSLLRRPRLSNSH